MRTVCCIAQWSNLQSVKLFLPCAESSAAGCCDLQALVGIRCCQASQHNLIAKHGAGCTYAVHTTSLKAHMLVAGLLSSVPLCCCHLRVQLVRKVLRPVPAKELTDSYLIINNYCDITLYQIARATPYDTRTPRPLPYVTTVYSRVTASIGAY